MPDQIPEDQSLCVSSAVITSRWILHALLLALTSSGCATSPQRQGSSLLLDVQPAEGPRFGGMYDFEIVDLALGAACARSEDAKTLVYWVAGDLRNISSDPLTTQAINAAAYDAISHISDADTILLTRVIAKTKGPDQVCVQVWGRALRITKYQPKVEHVTDEAEGEDEGGDEDDAEHDDRDDEPADDDTK